MSVQGEDRLFSPGDALCIPFFFLPEILRGELAAGQEGQRPQPRVTIFGNAGVGTGYLQGDSARAPC